MSNLSKTLSLPNPPAIKLNQAKSGQIQPKINFPHFKTINFDPPRALSPLE